MEIPPFPEAVARICARDGRYAPEAFAFLNDGLLKTLQQVQEKEKKPRQISGVELAEGLRAHALASYGPLALTVLGRWGVRTTRDTNFSWKGPKPMASSAISTVGLS